MGKAITEIDSYAGPMSGTTKLPVSDSDTLQAGTASQVLTYIVANLGNAATKNTGTTAGTVAAGDDSRLSDERVPTAAGLAAKTTGATSKATPVDDDEIPAADSAASFGLKKLTWANIKATLKTYFDTLYQAVLVSGINIKTINGSTVLGSGNLAVSASPGGSSGDLQFNDAGAFSGSPLKRADANTVEQYNGTTAQALMIYNTRTDASNYERGCARWSGNVLEIGTEALGTGTNRATKVIAGNNQQIQFETKNVSGSKTILGAFQGSTGNFNLHPSYRLVWPSSGDASSVTPNLGIGPADANGLKVTFGGNITRCAFSVGSLGTSVVSKTSNYTALVYDGTILVDASGGAVTITGYACSGNAGKLLTIKKTDSSGNAVTFDPNASETVDGASTKAASTQWGGFTVQVNAAETAWVVVATF